MNVSAGAMREEYQTRFGEEFATIYYALRNDWAAGLWRLGEYRELFGDAENVELLNAIGDGGFIGEIQQILWDDLMMRLCRLTEPLNSAGKANLTVRRLPEFCTDQELRAEVEKWVTKAVQAAEFARDWRNRRIGHTDLTRAITPNTEPLKSVSRRQLADACKDTHGSPQRMRH